MTPSDRHRASMLLNIEEYRTWVSDSYLFKADIAPVVFSDNSPANTPDQDVTELTRRIMKETAGWDDTRVEVLPRSTLHWIVKAQNAGTSRVVRIGSFPHTYRAYYFHTEAAVCGSMHAATVPVVRMDRTDTTRRIVPFDFEVMEYVPEPSLYDHSKQGTINHTMIRNFGRTMADLHTIMTDGYGPILPAEDSAGVARKGIHARWYTYLTRKLSDHLVACRDAGAISVNDVKTVMEIIADSEAVLESVPSVLLHGDPAHHNVFAGRDGVITGIIDWEDALCGDPAHDVAYYATGMFEMDDWLDAFLEGYGAPALGDRLYWHRFWISYLRISLAKAVVRVRFGMQDDSHVSQSWMGRRIIHGINMVRTYM